MRLFYGSEYAAAAHEFDTTRKPAWIADAQRLYNAETDLWEGSLGGLRGAAMLAEREQLVWCASQQVPVAFVPAGGFAPRGHSHHGIVELHRETIRTAAALGDARGRAV